MQLRNILGEVKMKIRWENIVLLVVIITLIVLLIRLPPLLYGLSSALGSLRDNPVVGILALALICYTVFSIFKVMSNNKR